MFIVAKNVGSVALTFCKISKYWLWYLWYCGILTTKSNTCILPHWYIMLIVDVLNFDDYLSKIHLFTTRWRQNCLVFEFLFSVVLHYILSSNASDQSTIFEINLVNAWL